MNTDLLEAYVVNENTVLLDAMRRIDRNERGLVFVVTDHSMLVGSLTDGDIRRWIINGGGLDVAVSRIMKRSPVFLYDNETDRSEGLIREKKLKAIPIINGNGVLVDILFGQNDSRTTGNMSKALRDISVIVMAGGEGTRLRPYTKILPKPLIPIGDTPILERVMRQFNRYGAQDFILILNYKKGIIRSYVEEADFPFNVSCIDENTPSGTAGGIRLVERDFRQPIIISNCDVIVAADYGSILQYHNESHNDMTIVSSVKRTVIPYGVLHTNKDGIIECIEEKPQLSYCINTGLYVVSPNALHLIPDEGVFHMTDLAEKMISIGMRVGMFPVSEELFYDMGEFEELKKMEAWVESVDQ